jgi:hypothetical protein
LNNKKVLTKTANAIFLAIVLVAGTITLFSPSFMTGAQAQEYYGGKENNYENHYGKDTYKSKDSNSVIVKKINCNNVNVNVNGLEIDVLPLALANLLQGDEDERGAGSYGGGERSYGSGQSGYDNNSFKFICINNNNNTVIEAETPIEDECPEADEIESCFRQFLLDALFPNFVDELESGITVEINGQEVTLRSFEDICEALEGLTTFGELRFAVESILQEVLGFVPMNIEFFSCIAEALGIPLSHG